jgi:uncharacterized protein YdeI (YjbR/CyaY-like superfamily)
VSAKPRFFTSAAEFRAWLETHHARATEIVVGYYKRGTDKPSLTWPESVDEALCFGWIDGVRHSIDDERYQIRFTPRKPSSKWSAVNRRRVAALIAEGRMHPAGLAAFEARGADTDYSYEGTRRRELDGEALARLRANAKAWRFGQAQPPWYRRAASHWVTSAKQEATRERRLETLISDCAAGRTIKPLTRPTTAKK